MPLLLLIISYRDSASEIFAEGRSLRLFCSVYIACSRMARGMADHKPRSALRRDIMRAIQDRFLQLALVACMLVIPVLGRQRQVDLYEFKANLVYIKYCPLLGEALLTDNPWSQHHLFFESLLP